MKELLLSIIALLFIALLFTVTMDDAAERIYQECIVHRIVDGDTLDCAAGVDDPYRVRVLGYDAPELPTYAGRLARGMFQQIAPEGTKLTLWRLPGDDTVDVYGRQLWRAYLDIGWTMGGISDRLRRQVREEGG